MPLAFSNANVKKKETDDDLDRAIYSVHPFALQFKSQINLSSFIAPIST